MAKRKNLLLKESTISRMMGLAGIGALTNPFLREEKYPEGFRYPQDQEEELEEGYDEEEELDEMHGHDFEEDEEDEHGGMWPGEVEKMYDDEYNSQFGDESDEGDEEECPDCGMPADECECDHDHDEDEDYDQDEDDQEEESGYMQESVRRSMKRLKKLLEQAEAGAEPPAPEGEEMPPEPAPGGAGGDEMETKIKEFVKKLGELVQETLGVQVTVEEGEGEPEMPEGEAGAPPPAAGGAGAPPAPLAEAISRLVNKVARRVKARLMEAQDDKKMRMKHRGEAKKAAEKEKGRVGEKAKLMKEKQAAAKKKEAEAAKKKKEMEMKKKKAAMAKKK